MRSRALALAHKIRQESKTHEDAAQLAFQQVLLRVPESSELQMALKHVQQMQTYHEQHPPQQIPLPREVKREMIEELTGESFSWTENLDLSENYKQDLKPWDVDAATRALAELCLVLMTSNEFIYLR